MLGQKKLQREEHPVHGSAVGVTEPVHEEPRVARVYPHYYKSVERYTHVDVYRVLELFGVTHPARAHAIKKLLCAGDRGNKNLLKDLQEAVVSVQREIEMRQEDVSDAN
jgi:hypothetical protein